ncbi:polysaccharide deacetylase family protein [Alteromonas pelagimontana]|uniref:Polysaccharide deacetylase family protein n=1 Tax=Alteromonas pelagimontana TaxID=1858656 RepID=A0A6M4MCK2_9ALTE|nr:polysaccharide deacetylase family protein [Alteromonas pelagimontana]QJR80852.1 polysaccharide deacetylase family protein [Alteromonas pelagimontana]
MRIINRGVAQLQYWALALVLLFSPLSFAQKTDNAVILLYHHVAENTPASTSISPEQFRQHMAFIKENYTVAPLKNVVETLKNKQPLPDRTLVITFDDGYDDILKNAHPILEEYGFPYTVFINPAQIGRQSHQLTWKEVNAMQKQGATFANHTQDHLHMLAKNADESEAKWLSRVWQNVEEAEAMLKEKTGKSLKYLAYPFGEFNTMLAEKLKEEGYTGFGQHSGGVSHYSDFTALPRFPAAGPYAKLDSLKTKLDSLAMPVSSTTLSNPQQKQRTLTQPIAFTVAVDDVDLNRAACFYQGDRIKHSAEGKTLSYEISKKLPVGRSRVNCTAPSQSENGRYYWYSQPFFVTDKNGNYPD